jgi:hypothetical protein
MRNLPPSPFRIGFVGVLFAAVTWLNRFAALKLEESAATLKA